MANHPVVSDDTWIEQRKQLLKKEKEFSRLRDDLTRQRRELPWRKVEKKYTFTAASGEQSLADLFGNCSQLIVYHFMFDPDWTEGCKACSLIADHYNPLVIHLQHRDVNLVTVSRTELKKIDEFKKTNGLEFPLGVVAGKRFQSGLSCHVYARGT